AVKYGTTVAAIAAANDIKNINNIKVGQVLVIP
ncbi:MAG: LysM peptidoglycan-binding domain-containing protein, partial [Anaerolineales bacterium]|nr:LysM peptidoglycan-binding domain-containing protein [Anaerolineales bacterium]